MIYHLLYPLHETFSYFNVFRYITFRTIYAAITALAICFVFAPWLIRKLELLQIGQSIREHGPETHQAKSGTPTMGGIMIIFSVVISTLLWANLTNDFVWMLIVVIVGFGLIGFFDDFNKLTQKSSKGISGRTRLILEFGIALFIGVILYLKPNFSEAITIPFFKTMLDNTEVSLLKADMDIAGLYVDLVSDRKLAGSIFQTIREEYERTKQAVLSISGHQALMEREPITQNAVQLRNPYIDPLNYIQIEMLRRLRALPDQEGSEAQSLREVIVLTIKFTVRRRRWWTG